MLLFSYYNNIYMYVFIQGGLNIQIFIRFYFKFFIKFINSL